MKTIGFICISLIFLLNFGSNASGQSNDLKKQYKSYKKQYQIYLDLRTIQGNVQILNHPTLGKTPGRNLSILFQLIGCKKCVVQVPTDDDGNYTLSVSKGKYRVISRGPDPVNSYNIHDYLRPSQKRIVDVTGKENRVRFDIEILLP